MKKNGLRVGIIVIGVSMLLFGCKNNNYKIKTTEKIRNFASLQETESEYELEVLKGTELEIEIENSQETQPKSESEDLKELQSENEIKDSQEKQVEKESENLKELQSELKNETKDSQKTEIKNEDKEIWTITEITKTMYPTTSINIRKGPNTSFEKVGVFAKNQEVSITGKVKETGWYRVHFRGQDGFVSNKYLSESKIEETKQETESEVKQETNTEIEQEPNKENNNTVTSPSEDKTDKNWVAELNIAKKAKQIIVVAANGSKAKVSMHNKNADGNWIEIVNTSGYVGKNGIGKSKEGDKKTPTGQYQFLFGFGIKSNPGAGIKYIQVDDSHYWVDDSNSIYYNRFVSTNDMNKDWKSAEHIIEYKTAYKYALAINYNASCTPNVGSAIFLHCSTGNSTAGCISVPESDMIKILKNVQLGCILIIDSAKGVYNY